ncbi:MAG: hypothetical protein WED33_02115 [Bacteroidia bacterium]
MPIDLLAQIVVLIISLPMFGGLKLPYRLLILQVFISLIIDYIAYLVAQTSTSNEIVYNVYIILETSILCLVIYFSFVTGTVKKGIWIALMIYILIAIVFTSTHDIYQLNYKLLISGFILISILNLIYLIHPGINKSVLKNPLMIISIAHIIYFLGVTPYFIGRSLMIEKSPLMVNELFQYINKSLMYIRYGLIAIAFLLVWRNKFLLKTHE